MIVTIPMILGVVVTLAGISFVGVLAKRGVKTASDFAVGGRSSGPVMVAGTILGSIVGGGGTVGTAQTAYKIGIYGWWQTLGLGIGCLILGLFFANHLYKTKVQTVPQVLMQTYGEKIGPVTSLFGSIAIFFSIISQLKSFIPLLTSVIPMPLVYATIIGIVVGLSLVFFGGIKGSSMTGIVKMVLIYVAMIVCGGLAYSKAGGISGFKAALEPSFFSIFSKGIGEGLGTGVSLSLGVLVTQIYIQAILSAKDAKAARNGAFLSAILTFPLGLLGCAVGMYMRTAHPDLEAANALPTFFVEYMPDFVAGIFIATLMITCLGSFSGLILGVSTMITNDLYARIRKNSKNNKTIMQIVIVVIALLAGFFVVSDAGALIQKFVFLSFGMRTCVFLVPMMFAFFYKGKLAHQAGMAAAIAGPIVNIIWNLADKPFGFDPVFAGLIAALAAFLVCNAMFKASAPERQMLGSRE